MKIQRVQILFGDIEEGARIIQVDPRSCVPLTKVRHISPSGLDRLEHSFTTGSGAQNGIIERGIKNVPGTKLSLLNLKVLFAVIRNPISWRNME